MKELSIIIPVYNQADYLEECLLSVINQDIDSYEIVVVNDGSNDDSDIICRKYVSQYTNIKYIYKNNGGLGSARNEGLRTAAGKYVMFLDSDDKLERNILKELITFAESKSYEMVYFDEFICTEKMDVLNVAVTFPTVCTEINKEEAFRKCMQPSHICARLYKSELFYDINFQSMWYEDMYTFPMLLSQCSRIGYFKLPIYYYRQHELAITHDNTDSRNLDVINAWLNALKCVATFKDEVTQAVLDSVATFCFFKPMFAYDYIQWYNEELAMNDNYEYSSKMISFSESVFEIQAYHYIRREYELIKKLKSVYYNGGTMYVNNDDLEIKNTGVYFICNNHSFCLYGCKLGKGSLLILNVIETLDKCNLIGLNGKVKEGIVEKTLLKILISCRKKIFLLEGNM